MEELQDAIEDAQYVNAIVTQEDGPRPILPWITPTEEQLQEWRDGVRAKEAAAAVKAQEASSSSTTTTSSVSYYSPEPFSLEWLLQSAIGYFLFSAYLKTERDDYMRINFCEEVMRWKKLRGKPRLEKARRIMMDYLQPLPALVIMEKNTVSSTSTCDPANNNTCSNQQDATTTTTTGTTSLTEQDEKGGGEVAGNNNRTSTATANTEADSLATSMGKKVAYKMPTMIEIDEYDLERPCTQCYLGMTLEEWNALYDANVHHPITTACGIGLDGPVRDDIVQKMQDMERLRLEVRLQRQESRRAMELLQQQMSVRSGISNASDDAISVEESLELLPPLQRSMTTATSTLTTSNVPVRILDQRSQMDDDAEQSTRSLANHLLLLRLGGSDGASQDDVRYLPNDLFDKAEALIMESLRREYWNDFLTSEQYAKLNMFLWNQYRPVVVDDFFVMRVLGRGGFGLVTGTWH